MKLAKLSEFGYKQLERLETKTEEFCNDQIDGAKMHGIARSGNTTARIMDSTLRVEKFNTAMAIAK